MRLEILSVYVGYLEQSKTSFVSVWFEKKRRMIKITKYSTIRWKCYITLSVEEMNEVAESFQS